jgi:hypothetical protein
VELIEMIKEKSPVVGCSQYSNATRCSVTGMMSLAQFTWPVGCYFYSSRIPYFGVLDDTAL